MCIKACVKAFLDNIVGTDVTVWGAGYILEIIWSIQV